MQTETVQIAGGPSRASSHGVVPRDRRRRRVTVGALLWVGLGLSAALAAEDVNRVVLRVNDEIATLQDYENRKSSEIARLLSDPAMAGGDRQEMLKRIGPEVMQSLFTELLLLSFADQHGIRITEREIDGAIRDMQQSQGFESREELEQALAGAGMTYDDLRASARREMVWNQVIGQEVNAKIKIGEEEVRGYYRNHAEVFQQPEKRWLKEVIVLESSGLDEGELQRLAGEIQSDLAAGGDFETVTEPHRSQEVTTGVIDLGWLMSDELGESLAEAAWSLRPGQYSSPIRARGGYHILHLVELQPAVQQLFAEVQDLITRQMRGQRFNKELRAFMTRLEQQSYIRENVPSEAVGYRALRGDPELEDELEIFRSPVVAGERDGSAGDRADDEDGAGASRR